MERRCAVRFGVLAGCSCGCFVFFYSYEYLAYCTSLESQQDLYLKIQENNSTRLYFLIRSYSLA
jgi:hypothetical protein